MRRQHEIIEWVHVFDGHPYDEIGVMLFCPNADDPIVRGFYRDGRWWRGERKLVEGVTYWAHLPEGPRFGRT